MRQITVVNPETIYVSFPDELPRYFELLDENNNITYYFRYLDGKTKRIKFNIPHGGSYLSNREFNIVKREPIKTPFNLPCLPYPDRNRISVDIEVILNENLKGTPAAIYTFEGIIEVSNFFLSLPKQIGDFLLYHEFAHNLYSNESDCDLFALVSCLRKGYNRSMCFYALDEILSTGPENMERIKNVFNNIQLTQRNKL